jgi:tetratricopeptide (TPR) repeat protein
VIDFGIGKRRAQKLHDEASALDHAGKGDEAIATYQLAIEADPQKSESYYNIGLIYKYRNAWEDSREFNRRAYAIDPQDEAARWNLAIAATALRDWETARLAWKDQGLSFDCVEGPINANFGQTPVRLNPDGSAEVVWARRIDPVRARIENIPLPDSGFRCGDVVLHDGAGVGYRMLGERECPVFNVLELFEASCLSTFELMIDLETADDAEQFLEKFSSANIDVEDWTASYRVLCKQCSEGRPHEQHDHTGSDAPAGWQVRRHIGIAAMAASDIEAVLASWTGPGAQTRQLTCGLRAPA